MDNYRDYSNQELIELLNKRDDQIASLRDAIGNFKDMLRERNAVR